MHSTQKDCAGKRTDEIAKSVGSLPYAEVIHRDNLVATSIPKHGGASV